MINVNEIIRQTRAEVLAACIKVCRVQEENAGRWGDAAKHICEDLEQLQPAAKDLEEHDRQLQIESYNAAKTLFEKDLKELLREAKLGELELFHPTHCYAAKKDDRFRFGWPCCGIGKRIAELEKARASEGEG